MLNWIQALALLPLPHLLPPGAGGASSTPAPGLPHDGWLEPVLRSAQLQSLTRSRTPMTLFAPTDAALQRAGLALDALCAEALQLWLMRHLTLLDSPSAAVVSMLDGSLLRRDVGGRWRDASGALVREVQPEVGLGHLRVRRIDGPLRPATASLWHQIAADPALARFAEALDRTGLGPMLGCAGPFTVFAPSNAALDRAPARLGLRRLALWSDPARLGGLLRQHVVPGRWCSADLPWGGSLRNWAGASLHLTPLGHLRAGGCIAQALADGIDQPCRNGVLHRLHDALLPPD